MQHNNNYYNTILGQIGYPLIGVTYSPENISDFGVLILRSSNIQNNQLSFKDNVYIEKQLNDKLFMRKNDLLICVRNGSKDLIGKSVLIKEKMENVSFGAFMCVFRSEHNRYLSYFFQTIAVKRQIDCALGATINQITNRAMNEITVDLPNNSIFEQHIVDIMESVDKLIDSIEKRYKKQELFFDGLLHKVFSSKELISVSLTTIFDFSKGTQINGDELSNQFKYPMYNGGVSLSGYTNEYNTIAPSIIISEGGNSCGFVNYIENNFWAGGHCYVVTTKQMDKLYGYFLLKYHEKSIMRLRVGSGLPNVQKKALNEYEVRIENDLQKQKNIGLILYSYFLLQKSIEKQKNKYKNIREGLLEGLFSGEIDISNLNIVKEKT